MLTLVTNYLSVRSLERSVRSQLLSISAAKTTQLENFIRERRADISVISQVPRTIQATEELSQELAKGSLTEADRSQREKTLPARRPSTYLEAYGYANLYLFGTDGRLLFRVKSDLEPGRRTC